jgi:CheY-like chemotaxis protein
LDLYLHYLYLNIAFRKIKISNFIYISMPEQKTKYNAIMLIDDNEIDNLINQKIIESSNICKNIFTHTGGKSAIEFLKNMEKIAASVPGCLPEVIFLDIDMPLMDGSNFWMNLTNSLETPNNIAVLLC